MLDRSMRAFLFAAILLITNAPLFAQPACSSDSKTAAAQALRSAQTAALNLVSDDMSSGVSNTGAPLLLVLKSALADAADAELACHTASESGASLQTALSSFLRAAAPGLPTPPESKLIQGADKPRKGIFGNDVAVRAELLVGPPRLLKVEIDSSVPCGTDAQLLIYEAAGGHWRRALRWSSDFQPHSGNRFAWGDFFLTKILVLDPTKPDGWRAVVAHGTPWCTSRMSSFGLAVLSPTPDGKDGHVVWKTDRGYSRFAFDPTLKVSGNTFELRVHADEMDFNGSGFERLVVYRYRVTDGGVTRLEPIAANGRGFVEEWLSAPWQEAAEQTAHPAATALHEAHHRYETSYPPNSNVFTSWEAGPVRSCSDGDKFQVEFDTARNLMVPGKPGGDHGPSPSYYFLIQHVPDGYQMLSVSQHSGPACTGPDLMNKSSQ